MATGVLSAVLMPDGTDVVSSSGYYNVLAGGGGDDVQGINNVSLSNASQIAFRTTSASARASWSRAGSACGIWQVNSFDSTLLRFNPQANTNFSVAFYMGVNGVGVAGSSYKFSLPVNVITNSISLDGGTVVVSSNGTTVVKVTTTTPPTDQVLYVLVEYPVAFTMPSNSISWELDSLVGTTSFYGLQMVQVSGTAQPPANCLGGDTRVVISEKGDTKALKDLGPHPKVLIKDSCGISRLIESSLLRTKQIIHEKAYSYKGITLSEAHILLDRPSYGFLHQCSHCGANGKAYGSSKSSKGCKRCSEVRVDGYSPLSPRDCLTSSRLFKETDYVGFWYHLYLPEPYTDAAIVLQTPDRQEVLSEGFRHRLGSKKRDELWLEITE